MTKTAFGIPSSEMGLQWLLSPVVHETFVNDFWGKSPLRICREDAGHYSHLLSEIEMEFALFTAARTPGALEILSEDDRPQRCQSHIQAIEAFRQGKSLRVDGIQRFSLPVTLLCRNLEQTINCSINVNMYLTPGSGKKALKRHYDTHDVFVLQIHGHKIWRLYDPPFLAPLEFLPLQRHESIRDMAQFRLNNDFSGRENTTLKEEFTLKAGDFLYLPRGFWHEAESEPDQISCHLTVGVQPTTYLDLLNVALSQVAVSDLHLREPLPFGFATDSSTSQIIADQVVKVADIFTQKLNAKAALGGIAAHFFRIHKIGFENHLLRPLDRISVEAVGVDTLVRIRKGMVCGINGGVSPAQIVFGSKEFEITPAYEAACRFVVKAGCISASQLPGDLTLPEKLVLVRQLISEGLLVPIDSDERSDEPSATDLKWIPTLVDMEAKTVRWLDFGNRLMAEPFFQQTVQQYKRENPTCKQRTTGFGALTRLEEDLLPSGFIFHISRCGSTLLANGLKALDNTIVISEPQPINGVLASFPPADSVASENRLTPTYQYDLLRGLVSAYGQRRTGKEKAFVIKFSSWNILHIATIRKLWPKIPCVIVVRNPVEVAASCLSEPPGWMRWKQEGHTLRTVLDWDTNALPTITNSSFCSRVLGEFLRNAVLGKESGCDILDYKHLTESSIGSVAHLFGIELTSAGFDAIQTKLSVYSKDPFGKRLFVEDQKSKQAKITEAVRSEIDLWTRPAYENLFRTLPSETTEFV